jgi:hypothetical protein
MLFSWKHATLRLGLGLSALLLVMLLAACGFGGSASSTPTPTPVTPTSTIPTLALKTYTGNGFSIGYPQDWKVKSTSPLVFTDSLGVDALSINVAPNPEGTQSPDTLVNLSLTTLEQTSVIKNVQPASDVPTTATVGGDTWAQRGVTGTANLNGQDVPGKLVVLADNHPASSPTTQAFEIYYVGPSLTFDATNPRFQAMLQSFKFAS